MVCLFLLGYSRLARYTDLEFSMKTIKLPCHGIVVELGDVDTESPTLCYKGGTIKSDLKEPCTHCGLSDCRNHCDGSQGADEEHERDAGRAEFNAAVDILERTILAAACAGIDIETPAFLETIETIVDYIGNEYGE